MDPFDPVNDSELASALDAMVAVLPDEERACVAWLREADLVAPRALVDVLGALRKLRGSEDTVGAGQGGDAADESRSGVRPGSASESDNGKNVSAGASPARKRTYNTDFVAWLGSQLGLSPRDVDRLRTRHDAELGHATTDVGTPVAGAAGADVPESAIARKASVYNSTPRDGLEFTESGRIRAVTLRDAVVDPEQARQTDDVRGDPDGSSADDAGDEAQDLASTDGPASMRPTPDAIPSLRASDIAEPTSANEDDVPRVDREALERADAAEAEKASGVDTEVDVVSPSGRLLPPPPARPKSKPVSPDTSTTKRGSATDSANTPVYLATAPADTDRAPGYRSANAPTEPLNRAALERDPSEVETRKLDARSRDTNRDHDRDRDRDRDRGRPSRTTTAVESSIDRSGSITKSGTSTGSRPKDPTPPPPPLPPPHNARFVTPVHPPGSPAKPPQPSVPYLGRVAEIKHGQPVADGQPGVTDLFDASGRETRLLGTGETKVNISSKDRIASVDIAKRYRIDGEVSRGGVGSILNAYDHYVRRRVAMKVLRTSTPKGSRRLERFMEEAQITGQLEHPNIVPVHDLGVDADGRVYFTMKLVHGRSLSELIQENVAAQKAGKPLPTPVPDLLSIAIKACDAVAYAHAKNVIHRDLKPDNIMVGGFGEVQVMDWGLAKILGEPERLNLTADIGDGNVTSDRFLNARTRTLEGSVCGTPIYMPPEQARGEIDRLDARADVYSLGAILFECLTGLPPYSGDNAWEILEKVITHGPEWPEVGVDGEPVQRELSWIVRKAMEPRRNHRFATVSELQSELRAYTTGFALQTIYYTPVQRVQKWVKRNQALAAVIGIAAVLLITITAMAFVSLDAQRQNARKELDERNAQLSRVERQRDDANTSRREAELERGILRLSLENVRAERDQAQGDLADAQTQRLQADLAREDAERRADLLDRQLSAGGRRLLDTWLTRARQMAATGRLDAAHASLQQVTELAESDSIDVPRELAWLTWNVQRREWPLRAAIDSREPGDDPAASLRRVHQLLFADDAQRIIGATPGGRILVMDAGSGAPGVSFAAHDGPLVDLLLAPSGATVFTAGPLWSGAATPRYEVVCWNYASGAPITRYGPFERRILTFDVVHTNQPIGGGEALDRTLLAIGFDDGAIDLVDAETQAVLATLQTPGSVTTALAFDAAGTRLAAGGRDGALRIWRLDGAPPVTAVAGTASVVDIAFSPKGNMIAAANGQGAGLWLAASMRLLFTFGGHRGHLTTVRFSPDGEVLATQGDDDSTRIYRTESGRVRLVLDHPAPTTGLAFGTDDDAMTLAVARRDCRIEMRAADTAFGARQLVQLSGKAAALAVDARVGAIALVQTDGALWEWDIGGPILAQHAGYRVGPHVMSYSADGLRLAATRDPELGGIDIIDSRAGDVLRTVNPAVGGRALTSNRVTTLAFNGNGQLVIATDASELAIVSVHPDAAADPVLNALPAVPRDADSPVPAITQIEVGAPIKLDADTRVQPCAVSFADGTVAIYDLGTAVLLAHWRAHDIGIACMAWIDRAGVPGSRRLITAGLDHELRLWDLRGCVEGVMPWPGQRGPTGASRSLGWGMADVTDLAVDDTGTLLAIGDTAGRIALLSIPDGEILATLRDRVQPVASLAFRRGSRHLIVAVEDEVFVYALGRIADILPDDDWLPGD